MLSSLNTFGGLSAADILLLFNSNPSSSSSSTNATVASTAQSAQAGINATGANDPANAIQAILAQAQISHAQFEASLGGSASIVTAQAAYADQAGGSSSVTSASVTLSSPGSSSEGDDPAIVNEASLLVATTNGIASVSEGNQAEAVTTLSASQLQAYQYWSSQAQQWQAESNGIYAPAAAGASVSDGDSQTGQSALILSIAVVNPSSVPLGSDLGALVEAQAQQLVSSFEDNTLSPTSAQATGFEYFQTDGGATSYTITGTEVSNFGSGATPNLIDGGAIVAADFQDLPEGSSLYNSANYENVNFVIPLGS